MQNRTIRKGGELKMLYSEDRRIWVSLDFSYLESNSGAMFAKNYHSSPVRVCLSTEIDEERNNIVNEIVGKAYSLAEASKIARAYIKKNGLRKQHKELAIKLIGDK